MGALTDIYVAASSGSDITGDGSSGNPYKTIQSGALTLGTYDTTNGNFINLSGSDVLAGSLDMTLFGSPATGAQVAFRNWSGGPDGNGKIDGNNGGFTIWAGGKNHVHFLDLELTNVGAATLITMGAYGSIIGCVAHLANGNGIVLGGGEGSQALGNHVYDCAALGISGNAQGIAIIGNYLANGSTYSFTRAIDAGRNTSPIMFNIISISGATVGIFSTAYELSIHNNSIFSASGTGIGIDGNADKFIYGGSILNNLIEGFSGVGGIGIKISTGDTVLFANNGLFNNSTNYSIADQIIFSDSSNESLAGTPFLKSGANTFANRFTYFAPVAIGNVIGGVGAGGYPVGSYITKGAVQAQYVIPDADQVQNGITFGLNGGLTGTLQSGGGGGTDDWIIGGPNG